MRTYWLAVVVALALFVPGCGGMHPEGAKQNEVKVAEEGEVPAGVKIGAHEQAVKEPKKACKGKAELSPNGIDYWAWCGNASSGPFTLSYKCEDYSQAWRDAYCLVHYDPQDGCYWRFLGECNMAVPFNECDTYNEYQLYCEAKCYTWVI